MRARTLQQLKKVEMAPHTIDDSVRIAQQGVMNLTQMRAAFPNAYLEDLHGIGRVWVAEVGPEQLTDFEFAVSHDGEQSVVPFTVVSTIKVYLPSSSPGARMRLSRLREKEPELHQAVLRLLRAQQS